MERIWGYIAQDLQAPIAADNMVSAVTRRVNSLARFPNLGASVEALSGRPTALRYLVSGKQVVVYRYDDIHVSILRVFSGGENWVSSLFRDARSEDKIEEIEEI